MPRHPWGAWDALLYVPTVTALALFAVSSWYGEKVQVAYLLGFLACFFLFAGANRILVTRLMLLPSAPVAIVVGATIVEVLVRGGDGIALSRDIKLYREKAGRTFGLTGLDELGKRRQFIFHRGQFGSDGDFQSAMESLERLSSGGK